MGKLCSVFVTILTLISLMHTSTCQQDLNEVISGNNEGFNQPQAPAVDPALTSTTTTASPAVRSCIDSCRTVQHYNPVCGSDGVTYNNEFRLNCARQCGLQVQMVRGGTCIPLS